MILVLCLAGLNTRFYNAGFDIPKYLLPYGSRTIINTILNQLTSNYKFSEIIIVANQRDISFKPLLQQAVFEFSAKIHYVTDTAGQATTAFLALQLVQDKTQPVLIHNGDTILYNRHVEHMEIVLRTSDAVIDVFEGTNPSWCYIDNDKTVILSESLLVTEIAEKTIISQYASSGLYGFKSAEFYIKCYYEYTPNTSEIYISSILKNMLKNHKVLKTPVYRNHKTIVLGTPQEYFSELEILLNENN